MSTCLSARVPLTVLWASLLLAPCLVVAPQLAFAVETSADHAQKGAGHFKKQRYFEAALAFERAYQLDAKDAKNLRYAGRAWQEVGYWARARMLLERYVEVEQNQEHRASILDKLEALRKAMPTEVAAALVGATQKYPEARLEDEAALALEKLGDLESLRKAAKFMEVARLGAETPGDRERIEVQIARIQARLAELEREPVRPEIVKPDPAQPDAARPDPAQSGPVKPGPVKPAPKRVEPVNADPPPLKVPPPPSSPLRTVLIVAGGALVLGGGGAGLYGSMEAQGANDRFNDRDYAKYSDYEQERKSADSVYYGGIGGAGLGAVLMLVGLLTGGGQPAQAAWVVPPVIDLSQAVATVPVPVDLKSAAAPVR